MKVRTQGDVMCDACKKFYPATITFETVEDFTTFVDGKPRGYKSSVKVEGLEAHGEDIPIDLDYKRKFRCFHCKHGTQPDEQHA